MKMTLGDIFEIGSGGTPSKTKTEYYGGDIPWVKTGDLKEEYLYSVEDYITVEGLKNSSAKMYEPGTVLIAMYGATIGATSIMKLNACTNQACAAFKPCKDVLPEYLYYFLKSKKQKFISDGVGGAQPNISAGYLKKVAFDIVPLNEQERVITVLDKVNRILSERQHEIEELDNLIKARFVEVFGERGKVVPLTDYVWFQEGPGVRSVDFTDNGTILLTGSNINNNEISFGYKSDRFISNDLASGKYAHFICDKDDILVVSSAIAPEKFDKKVTIVKEDKKYCLNTGIIRFKPNLEVMTLGYFREFLKTDYFKHQVMAEMRGIAQMHFGPSHLKQMTILLPESIDQQIEFEKFVKQVDKSKVAVQKALDETQTLFDSLMQEYFG